MLSFPIEIPSAGTRNDSVRVNETFRLLWCMLESMNTL